MAFTINKQFPSKIQSSLVFFPARQFQLGASESQADADIAFYNPGDISTFRSIGILLLGSTDATTSTVDVFWKGASKFDEIFNIKHAFWNTVPLTTTETSFFYWGDTSQVKIASAGTPTVSDYMFQVPYLGFGVTNLTAEPVNITFVVFGEKFDG